MCSFDWHDTWFYRGVMPTGSKARPPRAPWDLIACGPRGQGPFRLVLYYAHGTLTQYFQDIATAFRAIDEAEQGPGVCTDTVVPDKRMIELPEDRELVKQCFREEAWANGARH